MSAATRLIGLLACLALSACAVPRGAGFEGEILRPSGRADAEVADFMVQSVTRSALPLLSSWPQPGEDGARWIRRQEQPASALINPGDRIGLSIWDTGENSLLLSSGQRMVQLDNIPVDSAGRIFLPYVGDMRIAGMSPASARAAVQSRVTEVLPAAQVLLSFDPGMQNSVSLVGGVGAPGSYPLEGRNVSLLTLLSRGGGPSSGLVNPQVTLIRGDDLYRVSLDRLYASPTLDTTLVPGDRIIVEEEERAFLSLGAAGSQAQHLFPEDEVTAIEALAIIGGVAETRANPQGVLILRQYPAAALRTNGPGPTHAQVVFTLDLTSADGLFAARNFLIAPGDLIYVTESPVNAARSIMSIFGAALGLSNQLAN